jgi:aryl sulfotransferase
MTRMIWLASYPKSGNTWFRMLLANLAASDGAPADINDPVGGIASARTPFDNLLLIDSGLLTHDEIECLRPRLHEAWTQGETDRDEVHADDPGPVRYLKVHDAYGLTRNGEPLLGGRRGADGAIVIVRDPRDIAPSLANHHRYSLAAAISSMSDEAAAYCAKPDRLDRQLRQKLRGWSAHVASWLDQTDLPVCLIRYEDLQADTIGVLRRALAFVGHPASDDDIRRAAAHADFAELRRQEQAKGFIEGPVGPGGLFFRRGEAGAWREELTPEEIARIEAAHAPMMQRLGYELAGATSLARTG